jgi:phospholipid-binding lipoprotein MlaA
MTTVLATRSRSRLLTGNRRWQPTDGQSRSLAALRSTSGLPILPEATPRSPRAAIWKRLARPRHSRVCGTHASAIALALPLVLVACAHAPTDPQARAEYKQENDPAEPTNRVIFAGNKYVDDHALQPVARGYQDHVPGGAQKRVHNFVSNLGQPGVAVNDVLQGNFSRCWTTVQRFAINTTVGGVGLFDVATDWGRPGHSADFGQTLGVWGVGSGPSVQLPFFGPSNVRDSVGKVGDFLLNPANLLSGGTVFAVRAASGGAGVIDDRANLLSATDVMEKNSLDYYVATRNAAAQRRATLVAQGRGSDAVARKGEVTKVVPVPATTSGTAR